MAVYAPTTLKIITFGISVSISLLNPCIIAPPELYSVPLSSGRSILPSPSCHHIMLSFIAPIRCSSVMIAHPFLIKCDWGAIAIYPRLTSKPFSSNFCFAVSIIRTWWEWTGLNEPWLTITAIWFANVGVSFNSPNSSFFGRLSSVSTFVFSCISIGLVRRTRISSRLSCNAFNLCSSLMFVDNSFPPLLLFFGIVPQAYPPGLAGPLVSWSLSILTAGWPF